MVIEFVTVLMPMLSFSIPSLGPRSYPRSMPGMLILMFIQMKTVMELSTKRWNESGSHPDALVIPPFLAPRALGTPASVTMTNVNVKTVNVLHTSGNMPSTRVPPTFLGTSRLAKTTIVAL